MKLTKEQIKNNLEAFKKEMEDGASNNIEVAYSPRAPKWQEKSNGAFYPNFLYRIRKESKLRAWKPEEVPTYAQIRRKEKDGSHTPSEIIFLADKDGIETRSLSNSKDFIVNGYWDFEDACEHGEYSIDGGIKWFDCGVTES